MPLTAFHVESRVMQDLAPGDTERFYRLLTEAEEKLLEAGRWAWTRVPYETTTVNGLIVLPAQYRAIVGVRLGCGAASVLWQEIDYIPEAPCVCIRGCKNELIDRGIVDGFRTYELTRENDVEVDVSLLVRYEPVAYSLPSQNMLCPSLSALKQAMYAINYENQNDLERSSGYMSMAIGTLDRQESAYRGTAKKIFQPSMFGPIRRRSRTNFP